jgi:hypothetical protein
MAARALRTLSIFDKALGCGGGLAFRLLLLTDVVRLASPDLPELPKSAYHARCHRATTGTKALSVPAVSNAVHGVLRVRQRTV